jgi:hypothetical protein
MMRTFSIVGNPACIAVAVIASLGFSCEKPGGTSAPTNSSDPPKETPEQAAATAPSTDLPAANRSSHFDEVSKHLDLGGTFYAYVDIDGDLEELSEKLGKFYEEIAEAGELPEADIPAIVSELGFNGIRAIGASSYATESGFRNKAFLYIPDGRLGLMNLLGGDAEPLHYGSLAPSGSDFVFEQELNLKALRETANRIVALIDHPDVQEPFGEMLEEEVADLKFTVAELLGNTNGRVIGVLRLVQDEPLPLPPDAPEIPSIDALIAVENASWLFEKMKEAWITEGEGPFGFERANGMAIMQMEVPPDGEMGIYEPVIALEEATGRVFVASRQSFLDECLEKGGRITADPEFAKAIKGLPVEGNSFTYISPEVFETIQEVMENVMGEGVPQPGQPQSPVPISAIQSLLSIFYPEMEGGGIASVGQNLPTGIYYVSNGPDSHKKTLASMATMPLAMIGGAVVPMYMMQQQAQQQRAAMNFQDARQIQMEQALGAPGQPLQPLQPDEVEGGEVDEKIATIKLRQTHGALLAFATENDGKFPPSLKLLTAEQLAPANLTVKDQTTGQSKQLIYLSGRTLESAETDVLLAVPWKVGNERLVIRVDGTSGMMRDDEFELQRITSQQ